MKNSLFMTGLLCILLVACSETNENDSTTDNTTTEQTIPALDADDKLSQEQLTTITDSTGTSSSVVVYNGANPTYDWDKKIIKTANIQSECKDYKTFNQQVHVLARQHGGWIASESESQDGHKINNSLTIKVPVPQFEDLVMAVGNLDGKTLEKTISTQDVTASIIDTKGRIAVRKEMRDKYLDLLHNTKKIDDALKVQRELNDMHENIEMASNQLQSMQVQTAYSTVNLHYYQLLELAAEPVAEKPPGFGTRILDAATNGGSWLLDLSVGLISIWPLLIGIIVVIYYLKKKKLFREKKQVATS